MMNEILPYKNVLLLGNSTVGLKVCLQLQTMKPDLNVTLCENHDPAFAREMVPEMLSQKKLSSRANSIKPKALESDRFTLIKEPLKRINPKRQSVFFEKTSPVSYDLLLLADLARLKHRIIKGGQRNGVYTMRSNDDIKHFISYSSGYETVIVESSNINGLVLSESLADAGLEVLWFIKARSQMPFMLEAIERYIQSRDDGLIRVITDQSVIEILGDQNMKAARLSSGKVFAAQAYFCPDFNPDTSLVTGFQNTDISFSQYLSTHPSIHLIDEFDPRYQTSGMAVTFMTDDLLNYRIESLVKNITGQTLPQSHNLLQYYKRSDDNRVAWLLAGSVSGQNALTRYDDQKSANGCTFKKIFFDQHVPIGCAALDVDSEYKNFICGEIVAEKSYFGKEHTLFAFQKNNTVNPSERISLNEQKQDDASQNESVPLSTN